MTVGILLGAGFGALTAEAGFRVLRQERRQVDLPIPDELLGRYPETQLRTNEILLLLGKD